MSTFSNAIAKQSTVNETNAALMISLNDRATLSAVKNQAASDRAALSAIKNQAASDRAALSVVKKQAATSDAAH